MATKILDTSAGTTGDVDRTEDYSTSRSERIRIPPIGSGVTSPDADAVTVETEDSTERPSGRGEQGRAKDWPRRRLIGRALAGDLPVSLTVLSYVTEKGSVPVGELLGQLDQDRKAELFEIIFDLYDADLLSRDGQRITATTEARRIIGRLGL